MDIKEKLLILKKSELINIARQLSLSGWSGLTKELLIAHMIENATEEQVTDVWSRSSFPQKIYPLWIAKRVILMLVMMIVIFSFILLVALIPDFKINAISITAFSVLSAGLFIKFRSSIFDDTELNVGAEVKIAEVAAFKSIPDELEYRIEELTKSKEDLEKRTGVFEGLIEESKSLVQMGRLFDLYSKQISLYQKKTQSRESISFSLAILSMISVWGS